MSPGEPTPSRARAPSRAGDVLVVAVVALAARLAMAWAVPFATGTPDPNCAPDEGWHFLFTRALSEGHAPTWPDETPSIYGTFLPTPYFVQALTMALGHAHVYAGRFPTAEAWARGFQAARFGSALLGVVTSVAILLLVSTWTRSRAAGVLAGLGVALHPQAVFLGAYTNADAFTICVGILHALAVARWALAGEGPDHLVSVGATGGLVLVGKLSGYFLLPATAAWVAWALWRRRVGVGPLLRAAAACAAIAAPVMVWNALRNGGDVLGLRHYDRFLEVVWSKYPGRHPGRDVINGWSIFTGTLGRSSFGVFRNMDVYLPEAMYRLAAVVGGAGVVAAAATLRRASGTTRRAALWLVGTTAIDLALVFYNCWYVDMQAQGRYVMVPVLLFVAVAIVGPVALLRTPLRWLWPAACVALLAVADVASGSAVMAHPCLPRAQAAAALAPAPGGAAR